MNQMTVNELIALIRTQVNIEAETLYRMLDFENGHPREGQSILTGSEIVYGDYLVYTCSIILKESYEVHSFNSLFELQEMLLLSSSINPFVQHVVAIVDGKVKPFAIEGYHEGVEPIRLTKGENDQLFIQLGAKWVQWLDEETLDGLQRAYQYTSPLRFIEDNFLYEPELFKPFYESLSKEEQTIFEQRLQKDMEEKNAAYHEFKAYASQLKK